MLRCPQSPEAQAHQRVSEEMIHRSDLNTWHSVCPRPFNNCYHSVCFHNYVSSPYINIISLCCWVLRCSRLVCFRHQQTVTRARATRTIHFAVLIPFTSQYTLPVDKETHSVSAGFLKWQGSVPRDTALREACKRGIDSHSQRSAYTALVIWDIR